MMTSTRGYVRILLQNGVDAFKWPQWIVSYSISNFIVRTRPASFRPHKIIFAIANKHSRSFYIIFRGNFLVVASIIKRKEFREIITQLDHITVFPTPVVHIESPIFIPEHILINWLCAVYIIIDERFAQ